MQSISSPSPKIFIDYRPHMRFSHFVCKSFSLSLFPLSALYPPFSTSKYKYVSFPCSSDSKESNPFHCSCIKGVQCTMYAYFISHSLNTKYRTRVQSRQRENTHIVPYTIHCTFYASISFILHALCVLRILYALCMMKKKRLTFELWAVNKRIWEWEWERRQIYMLRTENREWNSEFTWKSTRKLIFFFIPSVSLLFHVQCTIYNVFSVQCAVCNRIRNEQVEN